jgi:hypothetical protein
MSPVVIANDFLLLAAGFLFLVAGMRHCGRLALSWPRFSGFSHLATAGTVAHSHMLPTVIVGPERTLCSARCASIRPSSGSRVDVVMYPYHSCTTVSAPRPAKFKALVAQVGRSSVGTKEAALAVNYGLRVSSNYHISKNLYDNGRLISCYALMQSDRA